MPSSDDDRRSGGGPLVEVRGLTKTYRSGSIEVTALSAVDLDVHDGEFVAVMGPSGSGKSTLLQIVGALDRPTSGTVRLGDVDLDGLNRSEVAVLRRRRIGYVFQAYNLVPAFSARENVALPLELDGMDAAQLAETADQALTRVGLAGLGDRYPEQMSGGQRQRVAIARALIGEGRVLLADEPTGALDTEAAGQVMDLIRARVDQGAAALIATHNFDVAARADRVVRLRDGEVVAAVDKSNGHSRASGSPGRMTYG